MVLVIPRSPALSAAGNGRVVVVGGMGVMLGILIANLLEDFRFLDFK